VARVRDEMMPAVLAADGSVGLSMLVNRRSGRCIVTSAWRTAEAATAEERMPPMIDSAAAGAETPEVEDWEIAVLHRDHTSAQGACVRVTWLRLDAQQIDRGVDVFKMGALRSVEEFDGFCSASLFVNRQSGRAVISVTFDSRDAMERSRERGKELREQMARETNAEVVDVCEFELAVAHLRVPEMA
jgi:hypothetical protein